MKLVCLLVVLTVHLAASYTPCNPGLAFHGSDCSCASQLPYQAYAFSIRLPFRRSDFEHKTLDAKVQQAEDTNTESLSGDALDYKVKMPNWYRSWSFHPKRYDLKVQAADSHQPEQFHDLATKVNKWDFSQQNCGCDGECNCHRVPLPLFAPMDFYGGRRYRRSTAMDSTEEDLAFLKSQKPVKSKKVSKSFKNSDEIFGNLEGDTYVLERETEK